MAIVSYRYGDFEVPDKSDLIIDSIQNYGEWAEQEVELLLQFVRAGDVVIDAGAFVGSHSRAFSQKVGCKGIVYSFEPNSEIFEVLVNNVELAPIDNIIPYSLALGANRKKVTLCSGDSNNLGASVVREGGGEQKAVSVAMMPLDELDIDHVNFIKADVEGMEADVLEGGRKLIQKCHPVIFLELNDLEHGNRCLSLAKTLGYQVYGVISNAYNIDNFNSNANNIFGDAKECGLLLIHQQQVRRWRATITRLDLRAAETLDDLALLLFRKPQYFSDKRTEAFRATSVSELRAQLYLSERGSTGAISRHCYCEERSVVSAYKLDGSSQEIWFTLPSDFVQIGCFRLDIANTPLAALVQRVVIEDPSGHMMWRWQLEAEAFESLVDTLLVRCDEGVWILCLSDDPQLELSLPEEILLQLSPGCRLIVELTPHPLLKALPDVLAQGQVLAEFREEGRTNLPASSNFTKEVVEAAQLMKAVVELRNNTIENQRFELSRLRGQQEDLEAHVHRAEAQLEVLKEFVKGAFGQASERI